MTTIGSSTLLPGPAFAYMLATKGMTQSEAARHMGYTAKHINQVVCGHVAITPDFAVRATLLLDIDGRLLLQAQSILDFTVREHYFGTSGKRVIASGRRYVQPINSDDVARKYNEGLSVKQIAGLLGVSYGRIYNILARRPDVTFRKRGNSPKPTS